MKGLIITSILFVSSLTIVESTDRIEFNHPEICLDQIEIRGKGNGQIDHMDELIEAIIFVESSGREDAIGDAHLGKASVGCIQIRPIMVREVNRILKKSGKALRYRLKDRYSCEKSKAMFMVWHNAYHRDSSFEKIARNWNGGPQGYKKPSTEGYWAKIKTYAKATL